jgi:hypothetical protein
MPLQPTTRDTHAPLPTHVTKGLGRCAEVLSRLAWYCQSWRSPADSTTRGRLQSEKRDTAINNLYVLELKYQNTYTFNTMSMRVSYRMLQAFNFCFFTRVPVQNCQEPSTRRQCTKIVEIFFSVLRGVLSGNVRRFRS